MKMYKYILIGVFALASCSKGFLEVVPKGQNVAVTYGDYDKFMNGSNFYVIGAKTTGIWQPAGIMGDEVSAEAYNFNLSNNGYTGARSMFQWQASIFPLTDPPNDHGAGTPNFLNNLLSNLYSINKIVNEVLDAQDGTTEQKQALQAEAMTERAFTNFQLLNYFAKPYNAATAAADPGFPIITEANITASGFKRNSVQECYDFMIQDLTQAIPHLLTKPVVKTRVSKAGAETLLGKIYLFMGKYPEALAMFKSAFDDMTLMAPVPALYDYNITLAPGGSFLPANPTSGPNSPFVNITDHTESIWAVFTYAGQYNGNAYSVDFLTIPAKTIALFNPADWRLQFYSNLQLDQSTPIPGGRLRRYNLLWTRIGAQLPDLYLMKAEAEARTGDLTTAVADVETLRKHRMPAAVAGVPAAIAADQGSLVKFIIEERIREFAVEGARWFDMRRLSIDPLFAGQPAATHVVYSDAVNGTTYTLQPERLTLKLPPVYLQENPDMVDNP